MLLFGYVRVLVASRAVYGKRHKDTDYSGHTCRKRRPYSRAGPARWLESSVGGCGRTCRTALGASRDAPRAVRGRGYGITGEQLPHLMFINRQGGDSACQFTIFATVGVPHAPWRSGADRRASRGRPPQRRSLIVNEIDPAPRGDGPSSRGQLNLIAGTTAPPTSGRYRFIVYTLRLEAVYVEARSRIR